MTLHCQPGPSRMYCIEANWTAPGSIATDVQTCSAGRVHSRSALHLTRTLEGTQGHRPQLPLPVANAAASG